MRPVIPHVRGLKIGSRKTTGVEPRYTAPLGSAVKSTASGKMLRIESPDGSIYYRYPDGHYYRYACMCLRCRKARGHVPVPKAKKSRQKLTSAEARKMSARRLHHRGGGGKPRTRRHLRELPIGSRECITTPCKRYACICVDCRVGRGATPSESYAPPLSSNWMTTEARRRFVEIRRSRNS